MSEPKLKPCPFCGKKATKLYDKDEAFVEIVCLNRSCDMVAETIFWATEKEATASWNKRRKP